jgi:hypothetical protein
MWSKFLNFLQYFFLKYPLILLMFFSLLS